MEGFMKKPIAMNKFTRLHVLYSFLIACTAAFLFGMVVFFIRWNLLHMDDEFKSDASYVRNHIRDQLAQNETVLIGLGSFLKTTDGVDLASLDAYASVMMERFSHISMFQIAQYVNADSIASYQLIMKQQGILQPSIVQFGGTELSLSSPIAFVETLPVIFVAPSSSKAVLGLDLSSIEFIRQALPPKASSEMTISEPIDLFDGDKALIIMQSIPKQSPVSSSYVAFILIKQDMLFSQRDLGKAWTVSITVSPPNGKSFHVDNGAAQPKQSKSSYFLHKVVVTDDIKFSKYNIRFELSRNITWLDLDLWKLSLLVFMVLIVLAVLCIIYLMHFAVEVQRDRHQRILFRQANYDLLTKLPNRYYFEDSAHRILAGAERQGSGVLLLFVDLNDFKAINDNLGHDAGDKVLKAVGDALNSVLRQGDLAARLGGDEFVVLIDEIKDLSAVLHMIERVRRVLNALRVADIPAHKISGSVGFAYTLQHGYNLQHLLQVADRSMYGEKHYHHNQS